MRIRVGEADKGQMVADESLGSGKSLVGGRVLFVQVVEVARVLFGDQIGHNWRHRLKTEQNVQILLYIDCSIERIARLTLTNILPAPRVVGKERVRLDLVGAVATESHGPKQKRQKRRCI